MYSQERKRHRLTERWWWMFKLAILLIAFLYWVCIKTTECSVKNEWDLTEQPGIQWGWVQVSTQDCRISGSFHFAESVILTNHDQPLSCDLGIKKLMSISEVSYNVCLWVSKPRHWWKYCKTMAEYDFIGTGYSFISRIPSSCLNIILSTA